MLNGKRETVVISRTRDYNHGSFQVGYPEPDIRLEFAEQYQLRDYIFSHFPFFFVPLTIALSLVSEFYSLSRTKLHQYISIPEK